MSINIKKYTKDQMAKMVEETEEKFKSKRDEYHELAEQLKSRKKEIVELKSDLVKKNQTISSLKAENAALTKQIDRMNDEAINKANEIANLKADADVLRNKLADTEEALGRANAEWGAADGALVEMNDKIVRCEAYSKTLRGDVNNLQLEVIDAGIRANYAESHPWRNLWAWVKRKLGGE